MSILALQRCLNHPEREAVARCPECVQHYCRECIVEHDGRILCTACRKKHPVSVQSGSGLTLRFLRLVHLAFSFTLVWLCFFLLGKLLLAIPASFHEGEVWKSLNF